jgi:hypothetical protein
MERDLFYPGQWFKGRIYERRSDLSPDGKHLVYFAANYKPPYRTWTAVSRPPYLTAVVFWPNNGAWGGGGLFEAEDELRLNHRAEYLKPATETEVPRELSVSLLEPYSGCGEDNPIFHFRLHRDGWALIQEGEGIEHRWGAPLSFEFDPPIVYARARPGGGSSWELRMMIRGIGERRGAWYVVEYELFHLTTQQSMPLGRLDWADWCHSGDLVFAKDGRVWRLALNQTECPSPQDAQLLVDLRPLSFQAMPPPPQAREWASELPLPPTYSTDT